MGQLLAAEGTPKSRSGKRREKSTRARGGLARVILVDPCTDLGITAEH